MPKRLPSEYATMLPEDNFDSSDISLDKDEIASRITESETGLDEPLLEVKR